MSEAARKPLYFTFGNHMHWVDLQWLWGYPTLPDSVRDMLGLITATGVRGNVDFDGVGYEKMAAEAPEAIQALRAALGDGRVEIVGGSYGQPYGLFHGGESNVRQRVLGVRASLRVLGARPRAFWEEEFDFFPQLPQLLAGCGFTSACLFFQWTWHTPSVPDEEVPLVQWEGVDGTRLPTLAKTALCLHQWPEDFAGRLEADLVCRLARPALVQWLELMPSPDWMCRAELLLPRLRELADDPRFELRPRTLSELVRELDDPGAPVRRYTMDDVFHGMTLGKNADHMPRWSHRAEEQLLLAESLAAVSGLAGRPYASWNVYPAWELDEAWRELCAAQHHDNHECEGLCGSIGEASFARSLHLSREVAARTLRRLAQRVRAPDGGAEGVVVYNQLGWARDIAVPGAAGGSSAVARQVPAHGWTVLGATREAVPRARCIEDGDRVRLARGELAVTVCRRRGLLEQIASVSCPEGVLCAAIGAISVQRDGHRATPARAAVHVEAAAGEEPEIVVGGMHALGSYTLRISLHPVLPGIVLDVRLEHGCRPDPGMAGGVLLELPGTLGADAVVVHDTPYCVDTMRADRDHQRKYPSGDWMTTPQWFETVRRPFTSLSLVDLQRTGAASGLLVAHDGSPGWFRSDDGVNVLLDAYDPWDEDFHRGGGYTRFLLVPHRGLSHAERWRLAQEFRAPPACAPLAAGPGDLAASGCGVHVDAPNVAVAAFYRECGQAALDLPGHFAREVPDPFVVRLVELDGEPGAVTLRVPGRLARAARTNLVGEIVAPLSAAPCPPPPGGEGEWQALQLSLRPREIATVMLDLVPGRHVPRNLDAYRHVWATVHRRST